MWYAVLAVRRRLPQTQKDFSHCEDRVKLWWTDWWVSGWHFSALHKKHKLPVLSFKNKQSYGASLISKSSQWSTHLISTEKQCRDRGSNTFPVSKKPTLFLCVKRAQCSKWWIMPSLMKISVSAIHYQTLSNVQAVHYASNYRRIRCYVRRAVYQCLRVGFLAQQYTFSARLDALVLMCFCSLSYSFQIWASRHRIIPERQYAWHPLVFCCWYKQDEFTVWNI